MLARFGQLAKYVLSWWYLKLTYLPKSRWQEHCWMEKNCNLHMDATTKKQGHFCFAQGLELASKDVVKQHPQYGEYEQLLQICLNSTRWGKNYTCFILYICIGSFHMKSPDFQKSSHMTLLDFLLISLKCYPYSQTKKIPNFRSVRLFVLPWGLAKVEV